MGYYGENLWLTRQAARCVCVVHEPADSSLRLAHRPVSLPALRPAGMMRTNRPGAVAAPRRFPADISP